MKLFIPAIIELEQEIENALNRTVPNHEEDQWILTRALHLSNEISTRFNSLDRAVLSALEVTSTLQRQSRMLRGLCRLQRQARIGFSRPAT